MKKKNTLMALCLLLAAGCELIEEKPTPKTSGFESPEQIIQNPDVANAKEASGIKINYGTTPPSLEGEYETDGEVTKSSPELINMRGLPIYSTFSLFDQTNEGEISFTESIANIVVGGAGGYITGKDGKFTIWGESVQEGEEAGLPDDCQITVVLIMSGQKQSDGDLIASGLTEVTEVNDNEEYGELCGLWWMWEADFYLKDEEQGNSMNVALSKNGAKATAISEGYYDGTKHYSYLANDNNTNTFWASNWDMPG